MSHLKSICVLVLLAMTFSCKANNSTFKNSDNSKPATEIENHDSVIVGAKRTSQYIPSLKDKRCALYSNHTGMVDNGKHTLDLLLENGVNVTTIFSPEHGFRGTADAGEHVLSSIDPATNIPIVSLYGSGHAKVMEEVLDSIDAVIVDIQDVGLRFYTYYCTMLELMDGAARRDIDFIVLDRPNPNGMYVDGPILDMNYESGVGRLPIPVVHGLTLGEMALMANGEGWLSCQKKSPEKGMKANLKVVPCENYTHNTRYSLPIPPSPNLPNMKSIYLYPSLCYFEATPVSLGRGTDKPFQIYGHPDMKNRSFSFTPQSVPGAQNPPQLNNLCYGVDLSNLDDEEIIAKGINLEYLIDAYNDVKGDNFFRNFFEKLIGRGDIRQMIIDGKSADEIKATWKQDVENFKKQRKPYLLYRE